MPLGIVTFSHTSAHKLRLQYSLKGKIAALNWKVHLQPWLDWYVQFFKIFKLSSKMIEKQTKPTWTVGGLVNWKLCLHITTSAATIFLPISRSTFPSLVNKIRRYLESFTRGSSSPRESNPILSQCYTWQVIIFNWLLWFCCLWKYTKICISED